MKIVDFLQYIIVVYSTAKFSNKYGYNEYVLEKKSKGDRILWEKRQKKI